MPLPPVRPHLLPTVLARRDGVEAVFTLAVDAGLVGFQGHFPGHPVLPGVIQVDWAARFGREAFGHLGAFRGLAQVKFHRTIGPGGNVDLHLAWDPARGQLRFACQGDGEVLSSGVMRFGPDPGPGPAGGGEAPPATPLDLPQEPPMRLLEGLLEWDEHQATALARVDPDAWYAAPDGSAPGWLGLEWMAQAIAAHRGRGEGAPRVGYLLGTRQYQCAWPAFPAGAALEVTAAVQDLDPGGLAAYACAIRHRGAPVAEAVVKVFVP